jgi:hypothetical protein
VLVEEAVIYFESVYPIYRVDLLDAPSTPTAPVQPKPARNGAMAGFGGAMLGIAIVLALWGRQRQPGEQRAVDVRAPVETGRLVEVTPVVPPVAADPSPDDEGRVRAPVKKRGARPDGRRRAARPRPSGAG